MEAFIRGSASLALLAGAFVHYERDPTWWFYVPSYALAGLVCFIPLPNNSIWRFLSAISVVGGGLLMLFLWWTFSSLDQTALGFRPVEAKGLFPISVGVALSCLTRLSTDPIQKPTHYIRSLLHASLLAVSLSLVASSGKYFHYKSF